MQLSNRFHFPTGLILALVLCGGCAGHAPTHSGDSGNSPTAINARPAQGSARDNVVKTARAMVGAPYRYGGHSPRGFDCSGLVWYAYRQAGIRVPRTAAQQFKAAAHKRPETLRRGDLVFFADRRGRVFHVGMYIGRGQFVHAPAAGGKVMVSKLNEPYWKVHLAGGGAFL